MGSTSFTSGSGSTRLADSLRNNLAVAARQTDSFSRLATDLGSAAKDMQIPSLRELFDGLGLKGLPTPSLARARSCRLPECDCPSNDLGRIRRRVDRPELVTAAARLRNSGKAERSYVLTADPMQSTSGEAGGAVKIEPAELKLAPGESAVVRFHLDASKHARGEEYETRVRIRSKGCDDLGLDLSVVVETERESIPTIDLHCCCKPPGRQIRWYHHSYCQPAPPAVRPQRPATDIAVKPQRPAKPVG